MRGWWWFVNYKFSYSLRRRGAAAVGPAIGPRTASPCTPRLAPCIPPNHNIHPEHLQMTRQILVAAAALLIALPATSLAQSGAGLRGGLAAGVNLPNEDFGDGAKTGMVFQGWLGLGLGSIGLRAEALYSRSDLDAPLIGDIGGVSSPETSGNVDILGFTVNGVLTLPTPVIRPYIIGGVGYYSRSVDQDVRDDFDELISLSRTDSDFGWNAGAGISVPLGMARLYLEGRYHSVDTDDTRTTFAPIVVGIAF